MGGRGYIESLSRFGSNLGLKRVKLLLEHLGHPEEDYPAILVGGTNGKGSTVAMLESIYRNAGYRVGRFISPHVLDFHERFMFDGRWMTDTELDALVSEVEPLAGRVARCGEHPTSFEVLTALAYLFFSRRGADLAVMEVGMGGRLDATNVVENAAAVITSVGHDHMEVLGDTLEEIAFELGGIVRRGGVLITGADGVARRVLRRICAERGTRIYDLDDLKPRPISGDVRGQAFDLRGPSTAYRELRCPLLGAYQLDNAALAVLTVEFLRDRFPLDRGAIKRGLEAVRWPCRLEVVGQNPLVVVDGAHNQESAEALCDALHMFPYRRLTLLLSIFKDKDAGSILNCLVPRADRVVLTENGSERAQLARVLSEMPGMESRDSVEVVPDMRSALKMAYGALREEDMLLIAGSLTTAARGRRLLSEMYPDALDLCDVTYSAQETFSTSQGTILEPGTGS